MIRKKQLQRELVVDLTGPQGNSFYLLGLAGQLSKELGLNAEKVMNEMKSSDYESLLITFDKYFGDYVILER